MASEQLRTRYNEKIYVLERHIEGDWSDEMKFCMSLITVVLLFFQSSAQEPAWLGKLRELKVLESTRTDLERAFEGAKVVGFSEELDKGKVSRTSVKYKTKYGTLSADFSGGTCSELESQYGYDVPTGTLIRLRFEPKKSVKTSSLKFDSKSFTVEPVSDVPGSAVYYNNDEGIELMISNGRLVYIVLRRPKRLTNLACGSEKVQPIF